RWQEFCRSGRLQPDLVERPRFTFSTGDHPVRLQRLSLPVSGVRLAALALGASLGLAACSGGMSGLPGFDNPPAAPAEPTGQTIGTGNVKAGLIPPLAPGGQGSAVGQSLRNAAEMSLAEFPGADLTLLVKDDRGSAEGAQAATQEALREGAELIIGPLFAPS